MHMETRVSVYRVQEQWVSCMAYKANGSDVIYSVSGAAEIYI